MRSTRTLAAVILAVAGLVLVAGSPGQVLAKDGPPGPDGLPVASAKHPWKPFVGDPRVDTLSFPIGDVVPAAARQLEADKWNIFIEELSRGFVVTKWKQIHHPLLWLFMGKTMARVTVEMRSIGPNLTQVVFRGDLASHRSLEGNPMLPAAKRAYGKAATNWRHEVIEDLTSRAASR